MKAAFRAHEHAERCPECAGLLALDTLAISLMRTQTDLSDVEFEPSPFWLDKLKYRIHEMREQGVSSWETAIMSLRGWLAAFGAMAMLFVAISIYGQLSNATTARLEREHEVEEIGPQNSAEELIGNADTQSSNTPAGTDEDGGYDH